MKNPRPAGSQRGSYWQGALTTRIRWILRRRRNAAKPRIQSVPSGQWGAARRLAGFALRTALIYAAFLVAWIFVGDAYRAGFAALGQAVFDPFGAGRVLLEPLPVAIEEKDIALTLGKAGVNIGRQFHLSARQIAYLPTALLVALVLATPLPGRRRVRALLVSLAGLGLFTGLRLLLLLLHYFSDEGPVALFTLGATSKRVLEFGVDVFVLPIAWSFCGAAVLYVVATFRREDLRGLLEVDGSDGAPRSDDPP